MWCLEIFDDSDKGLISECKFVDFEDLTYFLTYFKYFDKNIHISIYFGSSD